LDITKTGVNDRPSPPDLSMPTLTLPPPLLNKDYELGFCVGSTDLGACNGVEDGGGNKLVRPTTLLTKEEQLD